MKKIGVLVTHFDGFWCDIYNLFTKIDLISEKRTMEAIAKQLQNLF